MYCICLWAVRTVVIRNSGRKRFSVFRCSVNSKSCEWTYPVPTRRWSLANVRFAVKFNYKSICRYRLSLKYSLSCKYDRNYVFIITTISYKPKQCNAMIQRLTKWFLPKTNRLIKYYYFKWILYIFAVKKKKERKQSYYLLKKLLVCILRGQKNRLNVLCKLKERFMNRVNFLFALKRIYYP